MKNRHETDTEPDNNEFSNFENAYISKEKFRRILDCCRPGLIWGLRLFAQTSGIFSVYGLNANLILLVSAGPVLKVGESTASKYKDSPGGKLLG